MSPKEFEMIEPQGEVNNNSNNSNSNSNFNKNSNNNQSTKSTNSNTTANDQPQNQVLDSDFLLLIIILLIFFQKPDIFSEKFKLLNQHVKEIQKYLDATDATLQALDQASQIPNQKLS